LAGQQFEQKDLSKLVTEHSKVVKPISLLLPLVASNQSFSRGPAAGEVVGGAPAGKCSSKRFATEAN